MHGVGAPWRLSLRIYWLNYGIHLESDTDEELELLGSLWNGLRAIGNIQIGRESETNDLPSSDSPGKAG